MGTYKGSSDAQRRAVAAYKRDKVDIITVQVPKGRKDYYKAAATACGLSLNQFAVNAMDEKIARSGLVFDDSDKS